MIWVLIYNLLIRLFVAAIRLASFFSEKPRKWIQGRKNWESNLERTLHGLNRNTAKKLVWLHASSVGEFEQGKPILRQLKAEHPDLLIVVSFFSPSGFEANQNDTLADLVCYLPADTRQNATRFIQLLQPDLVLWVKYEYWYHFLHTLHERKIPVLLVSAIFQKDQVFFKWYGVLHKKMLGYFTHLFLQNKESLQNLSSLISIDKMTVSGDSRFDRVLEITQNFQPIPEIEKWKPEAKAMLIAGSTWPEDEAIIASILNKKSDWACILAPHHVDEISIQKTMLLFPGSMRLSKLIKMENQPESNILIADTIGHLSKLYHYGTLCYVGGGFSKTGIHNILEPAVYGKPVLFGPRFKKYAEATGIIQYGGGISIESEQALEEKMEWLLQNKAAFEQTAQKAASYIRENAGATRKITGFIYKNRLLTR